MPDGDIKEFDEVKTIMIVLVTDVKYRMSLAALRDLGEAGHTVYALHFGTEAPPAFCCAFVKEGFISPECAGEERAKVIKAYARKVGAAVIFPVGAASLNALARYPVDGALVAAAGQLRFAGDKAALAEKAREVGVAVPRQYHCPDEVKTFPVVVKYRNGEALGFAAPQRYRIVNNEEELAKVYKAFSAAAAAGGQEPPLLQEYIGGSGYGVSAVFDREEKPVCIVSHQRLREYPIDGGPSALCLSVWHEELVKQAVTLLKAMHWQGIAMVEFRGSPETGFYLLEINPRIWGSFPLTRVTHSGFSEAYVDAAAGKSLPEYTAAGYELGVKMGFRYSNLAAAAAYLKRGAVGKSFAAVSDAYRSAVVDGVLEKGDAAASKAYQRSLLKRWKR